MSLKSWFAVKKLQRALPVPVRSEKIDFSYNFLATHTQLKELLARRISPFLEAEGFQYDGEYRWIGPWEKHSRRVVQVRLLKGAGGEFAWGYCFDFIPVPDSQFKSCHYQRTDKSAGLQLLVWTRDLISPAETGSRAYQFSLFGADLAGVERRLFQVFQRSKPLGDAWFSAARGPEPLLAEAVRQSRIKNYHWPAPAYIEAFLLSALGRTDEGAEELEAWLSGEPQVSPDLREKLRKKLRECANIMTEPTEGPGSE